MPNSRLKSAAERLLIVGDTLSDPRDIAITRKYVEQLTKLAAREVTAPDSLVDAPPDKMRAAVLGSTLRKAYPAEPTARFDDLLAEMR